MIEAIKEIVKNYLNTIKPTKLVFGVIDSVSPISIKINEKLSVPEELIIWTPSLLPTDIGKKVLMVQQEGGQQFYIMEVRQ